MDGIVTSVLNTVLSKYVKKFNKDEVDLSVWRGEAKLTNVELKGDALDFLNLPITIRVGFAGSIFLQVDWKHLNSKPAKIELEDLRIVCGPRSKFEMTEEMEKEQEKSDQNAKTQLLETWESLTLVPQEDTKAKPDAGYTAKMIEKVIDNIHVRVKRVHVRYEDNVKNRNFAFGISIGELTAVTTNDKWQDEFLAQRGQYVRKRVFMDNFAVYLNTKSIISDPKYLENYFGFNHSLNTIFDGNESRQYIVRPTGLELKVIMNKDIEKDNFSIPQIKIIGKMREISLNLGQDQYTDLMSIVSNITIASSYGKYLSYKPKDTTVEKEPKRYWKWAIGCVVRDEKAKRNLSWRKFALFGRDRNEYIQLYLKRLNATWLKEATKQETERLQEIERKYDYNDILYFRKCAVAQLRVQSNNKPVILRSKMPKESSSVFSGWFGSKKKKKEEDKPVFLTAYQKNYLYFQIGSGQEDAINFDTFASTASSSSISKELSIDESKAEDEEEEFGLSKEIDPSKLPRHYVQIKFDFELQKASVALLDILEDKNKVPKSIMGITFNGMGMNVHMRPQSSLLLMMKLQTMEVIDYYESKNMITRSMIQRTDMLALKQKPDISTLDPLLQIEFELNPLDGSADSRVYLRSQPITVDLHIPVFLRLGPFFVQERQVDMHAFERAALLQLEALQNATTAALDDAVAFHKTMAIDVEFYGPTIMLREDPSDPKSTKLVVDLGKFGIKSALKPKKEKKIKSPEEKLKGDGGDEEENELVQKLKRLKEQAAEQGGGLQVNDDALSTYYDCFNIRVEDIKIYLDHDIPQNHLLTPLNMNSQIYSSIFPSDPKLPTVVLKAGIPEVKTKLASSDIRKMYFMVETLVIDSYNEQQAQAESFKQRDIAMKKKAREEKAQHDDEEDDEEEMNNIGKAVAKLQKEKGKVVEEQKDKAEQEYFDEKTKLELLQKVNLLLSLQVANIQFSLVNDDNYRKTGKSTPIIVSNIGGTYMYLQQRKWDMTMEAGLSEVLVEDHVCDRSQLYAKPYLMRTGYVEPTHHKRQQSTFQLAGLEEEQSGKIAEFFKLNLKMVDPKSPKYANLDMAVDVNAGDVIFYMRPETIYGLTEVLIKNVLPAAEKTDDAGKRRKSSLSQTDLDLVGEAADRIQRERDRKQKMQEQKEQEERERLAKIEKGSQKRTAKMNMKIDVKFSSLQLYICAKQFNICKSSIEGFKLDLKMYPYSMDMAVSLGNILLTDETYIADLKKFPKYQYKAIMGHVADKDGDGKIDSDEKSGPAKLEKRSSLSPISMEKQRNRQALVTFVLNMYSDVEQEYPGYPMKMDIQLKGMRFTFLNRFVDEMLKWLMNSALLKIPQLITDQLAKSELMAAHEEAPKDPVGDLGVISEENEPASSNPTDEEAKKEEPEAAALPQMRIVVENMELIVPKSSVASDYIRGTLGRLVVSNDVLDKEDNTRLTVEVSEARIATRFGTKDRRQTVPLFTQPSIVVELRNEFSDISIKFDQIAMQLAKKQYEFVMQLLGGNLAEEALVATRVYPARQIAMEDVISDEQKEQARQAAIEAGKAQLEKSMKISLEIGLFSAHLLKQYGFDFDPLKHEGKDSLVSFKIEKLALGVTVGKKIAVDLTMNAMSLKDVSYDTVQNGVQEVYRDLIAFNNNFSVEDESATDAGDDDAASKKIQYPFRVTVGLDQESNTTNVALKMYGLQFTFGSVLYTLIDFANIDPTQKEKLPPVPEELLKYQFQLLKGGHVSQLALMDDVERPKFAQKKVMEEDITDELKSRDDLELSDDDAKDDEKAIGMKPKTDEEEEPAPPMTLKVDVQIRDVMVKLIRFPKETRSTALVLMLDIVTGVKMDAQTPLFVDAHIQRIQAYQAMISVVENKMKISVRDGVPKIIEPFDINAKIQQFESAFEAIANNNRKQKVAAQGMKGGVVMDPMTMRFGYSDFDILTSSLSAIAPPDLGGDSDDEEEETKLDEQGKLQGVDESKDEEKKQADDGADTESDVSSEDGSPAEPTAKQKKMDKQLELQMQKQDDNLPDKGELEFSVKVGQLSVVLINDKQKGSEMPLAQFIINKVGADLYSYKQRMVIAAQFGFYGNYWNNEIAEWEPMIEKWFAKSKIIMNNDCTFIQFLPQKTLNISFTYSMVQSAMAALEVIQGSVDEETQKSILFDNEEEATSATQILNAAKSAKSHNLKNATEFDLIVSKWESDELNDSDKQKLQDLLKSTKKTVTDSIKVGAMSEKDLNPYPIEVEREFKRKVGLQIQIAGKDDFEPVVILFTNRIRERTYYVRNKKDDANSLVIQATHQLVGGAKEICIHSPVQFVNKTTLNLSLCKKSINLPKNGKAYCPVQQYMKAQTFDCIPLSDENGKELQFKPVEELPLSPYLNGASYPIDAKAADGITYSMMLHTKRKENGELVQFSFESTICVENLLVSDLSIAFVQNDKTYEITIKPGETKDAYPAYRSKLAKLEMTSKKLVCEKQVLMETVGNKTIEEMLRKTLRRWDNDQAEEEKIEVSDKDRDYFEFVDPEHGTRLCVIGEFTPTDIRGAVNITFYVPYWIYDLTKLYLIPSEDKTKKNAVAGRGVKVYKDIKPEQVEPTMFNFHRKSSNSSIAVCAHSYEAFSRSFPPDAVGSTGRIDELYGTHPKRSDKLKYEYEVGVDINVILGPFRGLVKSIILMPRIILKNELKSALLIRQIKSDVVPEKYCEIFRVEKNSTKPFWWVIPKDDKGYKRRYIQFKKDIENWQWSSYLPVNETSDWTMTTRHKSERMQPQLIKVNITSYGAAMYITFKKADYQYPPYRIENRTLATRFRFCQQSINLWRVVEPLKNVAYGWDDPQREERHVIINVVGQSETHKYDIDSTTSKSQIIKYQENGSQFVLNVAVQMFGPTKVLIVSDFTIPKQEDSSMLKLKNPVNLSKIFRDEKLTVQKRIKYLDDQIDALDNKVAGFHERQEKLRQAAASGVSKQRLIIQVVEARNLVQTGVLSGQADPYIEVALHSKQSFKQQKPPQHFRKTDVMKNTRNPVWNKEFVFEGNEQDFYALGLDVKDKGMFSDTFMGGATIKLTGLLGHPGKTMDQWIKLKGTKQTKQAIAKNGDVHLKITFAKSESEAIGHDITTYVKQKAVYKTVQERCLEEIRKRKEMDPDLLPKQNRHRIVMKMTKNLYGDCFDKRQHELFFIIRCGKEARRVGLDENLFDDDNDQFALLEDFFVGQEWILKRIRMELWVKTLGQASDDDSETDMKLLRKRSSIDDMEEEKVEDPLYQNKNAAQSPYEFLGVFNLESGQFGGEEEKSSSKKTSKKDKKKAAQLAVMSNSQYDYDETDCNFESIRFLIKNIDLDEQVAKYLATLELPVSWTVKLADLSSIRPNTNIRANLPDFGLSVIDGTPREILYVSFHEIDVLLKTSVEATTINFLLDNFQIDVQRYSAQYCSMLAPEPVPLEDRKAFIHIAVNLANIADADNLMVVQYFSLLMQKFQLNIEEKLLWDLFAFGAEFAAQQPKQIYSEAYAKSVLLYDSKQYLEIVPPPPTKFFFKALIIQPLAVDFSMSVDSSARPKSGGSNPGMKLVMLVINTLISMVGNQDKVPLKLNALAIDDAFGDMSSLFVPIIQHYRNQGLQEAYKFIGGLDIIGNPVQLVSNLGTGVKDFFYEPINGITESPEAFVRGLGKGTGSLVSNVFGGVFGSVSKVTDTLGKIATDATFDEDAIAQRKIDANKNQAQHVGDGLAKGGISIAKGLWDGVTGLVTQPVKEVKKKGAAGIGSGLAKGVVGVVMKPVAGVLTGVTHVTTGIANTPDALMQKTVIPVQRRRLPRTLQKHEVLKEYKKKQALGSLIVWHLEERGLDGRQLEDLSQRDIIALREREKIMFQQIINNGEKLVCGTSLRFFSVNILKTAYVKEWDKDAKELTEVHSIWKATFGVKNTKNVNEEKDVTKKVKRAFKKTATLHTLPMKQFQPMHSPQMFGDPAPGKKKVLKIVYTSTKVTEKSALTSLFTDVVDTVSTIGSSEAENKPDDFDCLMSQRVLASVSRIGDQADTIKIEYYQYKTPSAITTLKSYNMRRIDRKADFRTVQIQCSNKSEAQKLEKKINKYVQTINPKVVKANIGYAGKQEDCTRPFQGAVDDRDVGRKGWGRIQDKIKKDENDAKLKYNRTLTVTYQSKLGTRTKLLEEDQDVIELDQ